MVNTRRNHYRDGRQFALLASHIRIALLLQSRYEDLHSTFPYLAVEFIKNIVAWLKKRWWAGR